MSASISSSISSKCVIQLGQDRRLGLVQADARHLVLDRPRRLGVPFEIECGVDRNQRIADIAEPVATTTTPAWAPPVIIRWPMPAASRAAGVDRPGTRAVLAGHLADARVDAETAQGSLDDPGDQLEALLGARDRSLGCGLPRRPQACPRGRPPRGHRPVSPRARSRPRAPPRRQRRIRGKPVPAWRRRAPERGGAAATSPVARRRRRAPGSRPRPPCRMPGGREIPA